MTAIEFKNVGAQLRHARRLRKLRLKDVATIMNCSESLLSKIECNKAVPSLHTLHRFAAVLDTTVAALFSDESNETLVVYQEGRRPTLRLNGPDKCDVRLERLIPYNQGRILNANIHILPPGASNGGDLKHAGEEVGYVLQGQLELTVRGDTRLLRAGSSFYFRSDLPHSYRNPGDTEARIIWVNSPPF